MFLQMTIERNMRLIQWGIRSHREGVIPPDTYVIDLDTVRRNARAIREHAARHGLDVYFMSKQFGRNPIVVQAIMEEGIRKAVAVSMEEARILHRQGAQVGHIGHLVQIPRHAMDEALRMNPDYVTVMGLGNAKYVSEAAQRLGKTQPILLRVYREGDLLFPGQEGGFSVDTLEETIRRISLLPGVRIAGVTAFPCLQFDAALNKLAVTPNFETLQRAAAKLKQSGVEVEAVNSPGANCAASFSLLKAHGATHVEPGHAFTGTTPLHSVDSQLAECPAVIYVSEVSHTWADGSFTFGGGFYNRSNVRKALIADDIDPGRWQQYDAVSPDAENIDYYGKIIGHADTGNTAIYAFRAQMFVTRSRIAVVAGLHDGSKGELVGLFDREGNRL